MSAGTPNPWTRGRFDARQGPRRLLFGRMYEDAELERAVFAPGGRILCIASSGCMAMALSQHHAVTAVDINPVQIDYVRERLAGAPMRAGAAERLMQFGRRLLPLVGWQREAIEAFLDLDDPTTQARAFDRDFDTRRFRALVDLGLSFTGLRVVYSDPLLDALPPRFGATMRARLRRCIATHPNRSNEHLRALLTGVAPDLAREAQRDAIELVSGEVSEFLLQGPAARYDGFTFSNILDGAPASLRAQLARALRHAARPGARVILRSFADPQNPEQAQAASRDRSVLWGRIEVGMAAEFG